MGEVIITMIMIMRGGNQINKYNNKNSDIDYCKSGDAKSYSDKSNSDDNVGVDDNNFSYH